MPAFPLQGDAVMTYRHILALALALVCGAVAAAEDDKLDKQRPATTEEVHAVFQALDRDDDQRISKQEAAREQSLHKRFAAVDSSGDGFLSRAEFEARPRDEPFE
jgi:Ca2+-binding EF-hand superfamily protein